MRTRETIEAQSSQSEKNPIENSGKSPISGKARSLANLVAPWTPETAPRNGGRPKKDVAQQIAKQVFENNPELIYKAFCSALAKGGAFAFQVLSDRAYGKLKEVRDTGSELNETPDNQLQHEIESILVRLGLAREADTAAEAGVASARAEKANGAAKDSDVLSR